MKVEPIVIPVKLELDTEGMIDAILPEIRRRLLEGSRATVVVPVRRRRVLDDVHLRQVAEIAAENPTAPTKEVASRLYTTHRNASRWIAEAKRRGFLAEAATEEDK